MSSEIEYLDRPPPGWHLLSVMRKESRRWDWLALMIDVDPNDNLKRRYCPAQSVRITIPGKHRNYAAACEAFEAMTATRH